MRYSRARRAILVLAAAGLAACAVGEPYPPAPGLPGELRVGVTSSYPPIIFRLGGPTTGTIAGVEADLARRLGEALGRPVRFVEVRWEEQISMLLARRTDIIMSGMSITQARQVRISFTEPYLETGQAVAMRIEDAAKYDTRDKLAAGVVTIGVIEGTTGEVFVQRNLPNARRVQLSRASDGALGLKRRTFDVFIHDAPSIMWLVSENEADLAGAWQPLDREKLAWGLRREDTELLARANDLLKAWKADGSLDAVLNKWLPYRRPPGS
jgi:polar amino acid transport system substrate-binding protein